MKKHLSFFVFELPQIIILSVVLLYTILGFFVVPLLIESNLKTYINETYNETASVEKIYFNPFNFALEIHQLKITDKNPISKSNPYKINLQFLRVNLDLLPLLLKEVRLSEFTVKDSKFNFAFLKNGTHTWTPAKKLEAPSPKKEKSSWTITLERLILGNNYFHFVDYNYPKMVNLPLGPISLAAQNITTTLGKNSKLENLLINVGNGGEIKLDGDLNLSPASAKLNIEAKNFPLSFASAYLSKTTYLELIDGSVNLKSKLTYTPKNILFSADIDLNHFKLESTKDQSNIFSFDRMSFDNLVYSHNESSLNIAAIKLVKPETAVVLRNDGTLNFKELMIPTPPSANSEVKKPSSANKPKKLAYKIETIAVENGHLHFKDAQIKPSFMADIDNLTGTIGPISHELDQKWNISLDGTVEGQGKFKTKGFMKPNDLKNELKIDVKFHNIEMTTFTPYSGHFAGYQIEKGKLFLDLSYTLKNNRIVGRNDVRFDHFTLGDKVGSKFATNLPVKLALALLKDRKGQIKFKLPVEGETSSPKFSLGNVIKTALINMIVNIVSAPFDYISGMFSDGNDLKQINFEHSQLTLNEEENKKFQALKTMLKERPEIKLEIQATASLFEFPENKRKKITEDDLRELSMNRAKKVQDLLADEEISAERLYILNSKTFLDNTLHSEVLFTINVE